MDLLFERGFSAPTYIETPGSSQLVILDFKDSDHHSCM